MKAARMFVATAAKKNLILALLVASAFFVNAADAEILASNPWNSAATDAGSFSQPSQRLAAAFSLGEAATATSASWYGTMFSADPLNTGDSWSFSLNFFADSAGLPETLLHSIPVLAAVTETVITIERERAYLFASSFGPVALAAGNYWLSIENTGTTNTFRWTQATSGNGWAESGNGGPWFIYNDPNRSPLNFTLEGNVCSEFPGGGSTGGCFPGPGPFPAPEPGSLALLGLGLAGLAFTRRRKQ